ncbi:HDOD domain-containing protein [Propionivibrio limicola]|uniref:HDOD domain-containing protein n=1 Tax=Propionivibrio limicola TaxID=167645 RepID=UPI0014785AD7|nr:HDOD domain-containing protein [Propionivibrio limicola]
MSQDIHPLSEAFREAFASAKLGELNFPTSLEASRRVLRAVENPDIGLAALAKIVVAEPLLSAKVIRLANSVALNPTNQPVRDVRQAVVRIGMESIKSLAMVLIMNQLRQSQRHNGCCRFSDKLWERSVHVAALSFVIAKKLTKLSADEAMFAGIVHDLGRFYLLAQAAEFPEMLENTTVLAETINDLAARANRLVLDELALPPSVVEAVIASRQFSGKMPLESLGDVLFVAGVLSPRPDPFKELDARVVPVANNALALGFDQAMVNDVIAASGDEIYSIVLALES